MLTKLFHFASLAAFAALTALPAYAADKTPMMIVLDGSNSMWKQFDGTSRVALARTSIKTLVEGDADKYNFGLITYGGKQSGCNSIRLDSNPGEIGNKRLLKRAIALSPRKNTSSPITTSLRYAAKALPNGGRILLISDGVESCGGDPCAMAANIKSNNPSIQIDVMGFRADDQAQLQCIAQNSGGRFVLARNQAAIADVFSDLKSVVEEQIQSGEANKPTSGNTVIDFVQPVESSYETTPMVVPEGTGILSLSLGEANSKQNLPANFFIYTQEGELVKYFTARSSVNVTLPVGTYRINALWNKFKKTHDVAVKKDEKASLRFNLATRGKLQLQANRADNKGISYMIYNKKGDFISKSIVQDNYTVNLPEGEYQVKATHDKDNSKTIDINLKAGAVVSHTFEF